MSDLSKTPVEIILDMINADNSSSLTSSDVTLGTPSDISGSNEDRNTELAVSGQGMYSGSVSVRYNRIDLADLAAHLPASFPKGEYTTLRDIVDSHLNTLLGINLTEGVDYDDAALPTFVGIPGEEHTIDLTALAGSLIYIGEVTLTVSIETIDINSVVTVEDLTGLTFEPPGEEE